MQNANAGRYAGCIQPSSPSDLTKGNLTLLPENLPCPTLIFPSEQHVNVSWQITGYHSNKGKALFTKDALLFSQSVSKPMPTSIAKNFESEGNNLLDITTGKVNEDGKWREGLNLTHREVKVLRCEMGCQTAR